MMNREVLPPRNRYRGLLLACLLTGCVTTAVHQAVVQPPSLVPLDYWTIDSLSSDPRLRPAQLCTQSSTAQPFFDGFQWRCPYVKGTRQ